MLVKPENTSAEFIDVTAAFGVIEIIRGVARLFRKPRLVERVIHIDGIVQEERGVFVWPGEQFVLFIHYEYVIER